MRIDKFLISLISCIALIVILNMQLGTVPPLGKFLNPIYGYMTNAETDEDFNSASLQWPGSKVQGTIYFDNRLVPHIYAPDDYSVYFLEGFVHAKYRFWQMETQTRAAAGRLSEILGPDLLEYDRQQRRIGMVAGAENALVELMKDSATYNCVLAYTDGVNRYLKEMANMDKDPQTFSYAELPLEYKLLNYYPEAWTPIKSMLLLKYMSNTLTGFDSDVEYTNLIKKMGRKDFDLLFPDRPEGIDPIIPAEKIYEATPVRIDTANEYYTDSIYKKLENRRIENDGVGSNNWAVAPAKTKNGNAILCNDPHLVLNLPSLWYEIQLHTPTQNVYGVSLPGAPGVVIGFNDSIAWGVTNGGRDVRDWYEITWRIDEQDLIRDVEIPDKMKRKDEYRYNDAWLTVEKRQEIIKIKGEDDFIDTVYWTIHGPMVYKGFGEDKGDWENLAMRWAAIDPSNEIMTFYLLNRAHNYEEYRSALQYFTCPTQNFVFASASGDIAITQQGKHAIKWPEQGRFILDGKDPASTWQAYIPWEQNPSIKNPLRGFVSSANQHPTDETYPYYYTGFDYEFFRNRRINEQLSSMKEITITDLQRLQQDNFNYTASEALPILFSNLKDPNTPDDSSGSHQKLMPVYNALKEWDYYNSVNSIEATYFQIWWDTLYNLLWDEFDSEYTAYTKPDNYYTILAMKNLPEDFLYFDILDTSKINTTLSEVVSRSFYAAVEIIDELRKDDPELLKWYHFKHTSILHIAQIPALSAENIQTGGYRNIVNATTERHGPSWRMVVEMSSPVNAYGIYPGGQSGHPGSKFYDNMIDDWAKGNYNKLLFFINEEEARQNSKFTIQFKSQP